ncbi:hypothetical protein BJ170DRAFT_600371 [Xylariales sp. AK1849]|nr:hypothetical protein BJ170DRAFT_600371 [Xylariales sp. AK1849]
MAAAIYLTRSENNDNISYTSHPNTDLSTNTVEDGRKIRCANFVPVVCPISRGTPEPRYLNKLPTRDGKGRLKASFWESTSILSLYLTSLCVNLGLELSIFFTTSIIHVSIYPNLETLSSRKEQFVTPRSLLPTQILVSIVASLATSRPSVGFGRKRERTSWRRPTSKCRKTNVGDMDSQAKQAEISALKAQHEVRFRRGPGVTFRLSTNTSDMMSRVNLEGMQWLENRLEDFDRVQGCFDDQGIMRTSIGPGICVNRMSLCIVDGDAKP